MNKTPGGPSAVDVSRPPMSAFSIAAMIWACTNISMVLVWAAIAWVNYDRLADTAFVAICSVFGSLPALAVLAASLSHFQKRQLFPAPGIRKMGWVCLLTTFVYAWPVGFVCWIMFRFPENRELATTLVTFLLLFSCSVLSLLVNRKSLWNYFLHASADGGTINH